jgi:hypothetical protein
VGPKAGLDVCEKSRPNGIRSPDRPARSQSEGVLGANLIEDRRRVFSSLAFFLNNFERQMTQICLLTRAWILRT